MSTESKKIVIIGGVAGGASAAAKARRVDEFAKIVLLEKGPYISYANCGLPYHISQEIGKRDDLFVVSKERLTKRFKIDVRVLSEALEIDPERQLVKVKDLDNGSEYEETYDKLIIATGAEALRPNIPGADTRGVFALKTVQDMDKLISFMQEEKPESAVVVGGGFIGLEVAEALHTRGLDVTVVEARDQLLLPWDPDMADAIERHMTDQMFIDVQKGAPITSIETKNGKVEAVIVGNEDRLPTELVVMALGVRPLSDLAKRAGIETDARGNIVTDEKMLTSSPNIFAVGDVVQSKNRITGHPCWLPMAGPANRQGRTAGANAAGGDESFPGVIGTSIVRVGKMVAARTGLNEREVAEANLDYFVAITSGKSHAGYYPGAKDLALKLIVEQSSGKVLGAQVVGQDGVDKRIDVLATAIIAEMTAEDIIDLELAYAPPFGSAKDPVNVTAMVAQNLLNGISKGTTWDEAFEEVEHPVILDVRSTDERKTLYVQNTQLVTIDDLRDDLDKLDKDAPIRTYCRIGQRGYLAERILRARGFRDVKNIQGGWRSLWGELREDNLIGEEPEPISESPSPTKSCLA